jgi:hypothetical protein
MFSYSWQRIFKKILLTPVRRKRAGDSPRLMEVELLENRLLPSFFVTSNIIIYVTGNNGGNFNSVNFTDPNRFNDGSVSALHEIGHSATFVATNLRSAVADATAFGGSNTIRLEATSKGTYKLSGELGQLHIQFGPQSALKIKTIGTGFATIDGQNETRIFLVGSGGTTKLDHLTLTAGAATGTSPGVPGEAGAILNEGNLTLTYDNLIGNSATGYGGAGGPTIGQGGAILNGPADSESAATLNVDHCVFDSNIARGGSGAESALNAAGALGGAICLSSSSGRVSITASTFSNNQAIGGSANTSSGAEGRTGGFAKGGALESDSGEIAYSIVNSTFGGHNTGNGNQAIGGSGYGGGNAYGGALAVGSGNLVALVNDTIALNNVQNGNSHGGSTGSAYGGGVASFEPVIVAPIHQASIISLQQLGALNLVNTIVALNVIGGEASPPACDVFGSFFSRGHNLIGNVDGSTGFGAPGDQLGHTENLLNPGLDPSGLQNNGGPTLTIALIKGSKAIDKGDDTFAGFTPAPTTDQRGFPRKSGAHVDIGAFELQQPNPTNPLHGRDLLFDLLFGG